MSKHNSSKLKRSTHSVADVPVEHADRFPLARVRSLQHQPEPPVHHFAPTAAPAVVQRHPSRAPERVPGEVLNRHVCKSC